MASEPAGVSTSLKNDVNLAVRYALVAILILLMLIPLMFVSGVSTERKSYYQSTIATIAKGWGGKQSIFGPVLVIPILREAVVGTTRMDPRVETERQQLIVLPDELSIKGHLSHQFRHRSIYTVPVYSVRLELSGNFDSILGKSVLNQKDTVLWEEAFLASSLSDVRGISDVSPLHWAQETIDFDPGTNLSGILQPGVHAALPNFHGQAARFAFSLTLKGTEQLSFMPLGSISEIVIDGSWPHPGFSGAFLPDRYQLDESGFEAEWRIQDMARGLPDAWFEHVGVPLQNNYIDLRLHDPVTAYTLVDRGTKYALLFITLTFLAFVCFELMAHTRFHFIQYGVVGLALVLFYLTLLSLSEHMAFGLAYAIATLIMTASISWYVACITHSRVQTVIIAAVELALYFVLYVLLQLEAFALAVGTAVLLFGLFALMYATRDLTDGGK